MGFAVKRFVCWGFTALFFSCSLTYLVVGHNIYKVLRYTKFKRKSKKMAGPSEREYREKLNKITENLNKRANNIRKDFEKLEKMKVNAMKKTEEVRISIDRDIDKVEKDIIKSKDLAPESKQRLHSEIQLLKNRTKEKYSQLRTRISETMIPTVTQQVNY